ncbi:MAG: glycoside hydrolase family 16 protein [Actinomycetaceae bacterium]|nr:glycoside hydrolase family 16 protein [Actinomycetaceae bacterium]
MRIGFRVIFGTMFALLLGIGMVSCPARVEASPLVNVALGKIPTTNAGEAFGSNDSTVPHVKIFRPDLASDGVTNPKFNENGEDINVTRVLAGRESGSSADNNGYDNWQDVYLQYDLGKVRDVAEVRLYHNGYTRAVSTFKNVKVEVSMTRDFSRSKVFGHEGDYRETKETQFSPQILKSSKLMKARYVRIWQKGHYIENLDSRWKGFSNVIGFREIEIYAAAFSDENSHDNTELKNIALNHIPYVQGLAPTNISAISDGRIDKNYAIHNSLGKRMLQFEYRNEYFVHKIVIALKPGTYDSIDVSIPATPQTDGGNTLFYREKYSVAEGAPISIVLDKPIVARTVRFTVNRDKKLPTSYSEIEIWASGSNFSEMPPTYTPTSSRYNKLVWADEFNSNKVDETKWNIVNGMVNHAAIYNRQSVSIKKDGMHSYLALNCRNFPSTKKLIDSVGVDKYDSSPIKPHVTWASGRVEAKNKFSFQYGRMVVRAKVNDSQGIWPAIWMLSQDETGHDEIDVMEHLGQNAWSVWTTNHYGVLNKNKGSDGRETYSPVAWSQDFHVYEVEWSPDSIIWFIDGKKVFASTRGKDVDGMHSRPMFPILEVQVGDGWVGPVDYSKQETKQNSDFLIDWIRVYQQEESPRVYFDDLDGKNDSSYHIGSSQSSNGLQFFSHGQNPYENKNNFYYGGQPRYETSRLARSSFDGSDQFLTYRVKHARDVHLTAYYQTDPKAPSDPLHAGRRHSIRTFFTNGNLDFAIQYSLDCQHWTSSRVKALDNFIEDGGYARTTFDANNLPRNTKCVRVHFPNPQGDGLSGSLSIVPSDVQLAKVTILGAKNESS